MHLWETNQYPIWFKARTLAWYNLHNLVELHKNEAQIKAAKRNQK